MAFPNGTCLTAAVVAIPSSTTLNLMGGSDDPASPCPGCAYDCAERHYVAWYTFEAPATMRVSISLCASTVQDTLLAVYTGGCGALVEVACSEDDCGESGFNSRVVLDVTEGTQYWIYISDYYDSDSGDYQLDIAEFDSTLFACVATNIGVFGINAAGNILWFTRIIDGLSNTGDFNRSLMLSGGKLFAAYGALTDPQESWIYRIDPADGTIEDTGLAPSPWQVGDFGVSPMLARTDDGAVRIACNQFGVFPPIAETNALFAINPTTLAVSSSQLNLGTAMQEAQILRCATIGPRLYYCGTTGAGPSYAVSPLLDVWNIDTATNEGPIMSPGDFSADENDTFWAVPLGDGRLVHHTFGQGTTTRDTFRVVQQDGTIDSTVELDGTFSSGTAHEATDGDVLPNGDVWIVLTTGKYLARISLDDGSVLESIDLAEVAAYVDEDSGYGVELLSSVAMVPQAAEPAVTAFTPGCGANTLAITGTGFGETEPSVAVTVDAAPLTPITVLAFSDTSVQIQLPSLDPGNYCVSVNDSTPFCDDVDCANVVTGMTHTCGSNGITLTGIDFDETPTVILTRNGAEVAFTIDDASASEITLMLDEPFQDGTYCATVDDVEPAGCFALDCGGPVPPDATRFQIRRLRRTPHISSDGSRVFHKHLELQMQPGVGNVTGLGVVPTVMMRSSSDGGNTWSSVRTATPGEAGAFLTRVQWWQLGQARDRVYEFVVTDPIQSWVIVQAWLDYDEGAW